MANVGRCWTFAMHLSTPHEQVKSASPEVMKCHIYLAAPDRIAGDDIDVRLTPGRPIVKSRASVASLHIGQDSAEAWFLIRPASEYPSDLLPN
jgi:hypothetical protein